MSFFKKTAAVKASFTETVHKAAKEVSNMKMLVPKTTLEIRDLDECTKEKIEKANKRAQCMAFVVVDEEAATKLLQMDCIRIGLIYTELRKAKVVQHCLDAWVLVTTAKTLTEANYATSAGQRNIRWRFVM